VALPFAGDSFDVTVAAFSLNHLTNPEAGLAEAARVTRPSGVVLASAYAADDFHPVKEAVESTLAARGWSPEPWYQAVRATTAPKLATVDAGRAAAAAAGLDADVVAIRVPFPDLDAGALVAWRLGLAQHAPFVASLPAEEQNFIAAEALERLGEGWPPLERSIVLVIARRRWPAQARR
jgi:SAM-dependent methyltransferase